MDKPEQGCAGAIQQRQLLEVSCHDVKISKYSFKNFDVTIDITTKRCYSTTIRCNNNYYNKQMEVHNMKKVVEFLQANPVQYLATVGRDGKAKCRPFMFCFEQDGKLWFCTNNTKDVYKDMQENPEIEVSVSSPEYAWIRLHGKAVFENNMSVKEGCMNNPIVKGQYQTADNPIFEVFYLENPHGVIADFSGNPPYEF